MRQILNLFLFLIFSASLFAQAPEKFKFQAVARDASGVPYASENLAVRVSLVRDGVSGLVDYSERHEVTTSPLGVFDLEIGGGVALSGMMSDANWANHPYYLKIDIDPTGGTSYMNLGTSQLLSVPYAIYAGNAGNGGGGGDPTDELQNLIYDPASQTLTLTDGNAVTLSFPSGGTDDQTLSLSGNTLSIEDGNAINLSSLQDGVDDADADPTNEIQTLNKTGSTVTLSGGGGSFTDEVDDADANASNELQTINLSGNILTLSNGGGNVNIPNNTDSQTLTFNAVTNELSISGGNAITIPSGGTDADADPMNEIQMISLSGNSLSLSNGGGTVNLPGSDSQILSFNAVTNELSISGGNAITIPSGGTDADADPMNELQDLSLSGATLSIQNGNNVDLSTIQDGVNDADADPSNEIQSLNFNAVTNELSISGSNAVTIPSGGTDADADPMNELQTISKAGSTVTLSNGGGTFNDDVNDADANPTNEIQSLSFNAVTNELSISGSNAVTIPSGGTDADADPMNELQDLSLSGTTLSIQNGNNVDLSVVQDGVNDADADPTNEMQSLSFNAVTNELSISGTNAVTIPSGGTDADADPMNELQTISKSGSTVTLSNGGGTFNDDVNDADSDPTNEIETWATLAGIPADIADGDAVNDADADPTNEMQSLTFNAVTNELSISGTNTVTIPTGGTDADADPMNELQTISKVGSTVTLSNGGGTFNDDVDDADSDPTNEIETWATLAGIPADIADGDAVNDADADPANEIQTLSLSGNQLSLSNGGGNINLPAENDDQVLTLSGTLLSIENGNAVDMSIVQDGFTDADADPANELQTLSKSGTTVSLSNSGGSFTDEVNDADADATNEIQTLSVSGNTISLSNGGGDVDLTGVGGNSVWAQNTDKAYYNSGNVGIGTNNPSFRFEVADLNDVDVGIRTNSAGAKAKLKIFNNVEIDGFLEMDYKGNTIAGQHADGTLYSGTGGVLTGTAASRLVVGTMGTNDPIHFMTGDSTKMYIGGDGRVGIGTTSPTRQMDINGTLRVRSDAGGLLLQDSDGDHAYWTMDNESNNTLAFYRGDDFSFHRRLEITSNGNMHLYGEKMGVGNSNPDEALVVGDNLGAGWTFPAITSGNFSGGAIEVGNSDTRISISASSTFDRARIMARNPSGLGEMDIEMRTSGLTIGNEPGVSEAMLEVEHGNFGLFVQHESNTANYWEIYHSVSASDPDLKLYFNGSDMGEFDSVSGTYTAASDRRVKKNVKSIGTVLPNIMTLAPSRYQFINDERGREYLGFIAQDVQSVFPELVHQSVKERENDIEYKLNYSGFGIIAIKAIQEQQQIIEKQEETIEAQNEKIENLEQRLERLEALLLKD